MKKWSLFLILVVLISCKENSQTELVQKSQEELLIGTWNSSIMQFTFDEGTDTSSIESIYVEDFPAKFNMLTVEAVYSPNGTFTSSYIAIDSSLISKEIGIWYTEGDSLYIAFAPTGNLDTFAYSYSIEGNIGTFSSITDWMGTGYKNDRIVLESIRID